MRLPSPVGFTIADGRAEAILTNFKDVIYKERPCISATVGPRSKELEMSLIFLSVQAMSSYFAE
jgi:hypothetical protein